MSLSLSTYLSSHSLINPVTVVSFLLHSISSFLIFLFFLSIMMCTVFYMFVWVTQERVVRNKVVDSKGVDSAPGLVSGF